MRLVSVMNRMNVHCLFQEKQAKVLVSRSWIQWAARQTTSERQGFAWDAYRDKTFFGSFFFSFSFSGMYSCELSLAATFEAQGRGDSGSLNFVKGLPRRSAGVADP